MNTQNDSPDNIIDLVEYRLTKELEALPPGSSDWEALMSVLDLYLNGAITVQWTSDDIMIKLKEGVDIDSVDSLFLDNMKEEEIT